MGNHIPLNPRTAANTDQLGVWLSSPAAVCGCCWIPATGVSPVEGDGLLEELFALLSHFSPEDSQCKQQSLPTVAVSLLTVTVLGLPH